MTIDSDMAVAGAASAPEAQGTVWDGHGCAGHDSPADLVNDLLIDPYDDVGVGSDVVLTPRTRLGQATLKIHAPDRWEVSAPVPDGCNLIEDDGCPIDGSEDTLIHSVEEMVAELVEYHGLGDGMDADDTIEAEITYWRQGEPQAFRLDLVPCDLPLAPSDAHDSPEASLRLDASGAATSEEVV